MNTPQLPILDGAAVTLRPITDADTDLIVKWRNTPSVVQNFIFRQTFTPEMHRSWLATKVATGQVVQYIIVDKADGRLALMGGISSGLLMEGPDSRIREAVREAIRIAGRRGGYFCTPDQGMPYPPAHLEAYWQAVEDYGRYPAPEG